MPLNFSYSDVDASDSLVTKKLVVSPTAQTTPSEFSSFQFTMAFDTAAATLQSFSVVPTNSQALFVTNPTTVADINATGLVRASAVALSGLAAQSPLVELQYTFAEGADPEFTFSSVLIDDQLIENEAISEANMATLTGTINDDVLNGTSGADAISGLAGNDRITGSGGNDVIRGGDGFDNVVFSDVFANYTISAVSGGKIQSDQYFTVTHNNGGSDGTDTIYLDSEFFDFADRTSIPRAQLVSSAAADDGETILGTGGNDRNLTGTSGNDTVDALAGDDLVVGSTGNDVIAGGSGLDVVSYSSYSSADVTLTNINGEVTVAVGGFTDTLTGVERLQFSDTWAAMDFSGRAGDAAKVICAAFGQELLPQYLSTGIGLADAGQSMQDLASLVVTSGLMGFSTQTEFVNVVYNNLLGRDANVLEQALYVDYLARGLYTETELLVIAAQTQMANALMVDYAIDSVGLPFDAGLV